ncbi:MAG: PaaI family thioesterase [Deltaproteobacteria bacterium]|nr:PaaI family thioesterase [Deltaproteobacteria bacterium]
MKEPPAWLKKYLLDRYEHSSYAEYLQMDILELHEGEITVSMRVRHELTNLAGILHGGAVGSLLDIAMNLACFSTGRRTTVLGFNTNFLGGVREGNTVRAIAKVLHSGRSTMVVEGRILDEAGKLRAKGRGTFLVTGQFTPEDQPLKGAVPPSPPPSSPRDPEGVTNPVESLLKDPAAGPKVENWLEVQLLSIHDRNYFAKYLDMEIVHIGKGNSVVSMPVTHKHTNIRGVVHGGALVSLADMSMMLSCASLGKRTVTLDLNISFVRRVREGDRVIAFPRVIHKGKTTMVVAGSIVDEEGNLLSEARGTFFVTGDYTPVG